MFCIFTKQERLFCNWFYRKRRMKLDIFCPLHSYTLWIKWVRCLVLWSPSSPFCLQISREKRADILTSSLIPKKRKKFQREKNAMKKRMHEIENKMWSSGGMSLHSNSHWINAWLAMLRYNQHYPSVVVVVTLIFPFKNIDIYIYTLSMYTRW